MSTSSAQLDADLAQLHTDAALLHTVIHGDTGTIVTTEGGPVRSMSNAIASITAINFKGAWQPATAYVVKDAFSYNGIVYVAVLSHTSTTVAADLAAGKIGLYQGVIAPTTKVYTAPGDFTPGTTAALVLPYDPGSKDNIDVYFGANYQGPNQYDLTDVNLSFSAPIPLGVTEVFVRIGMLQSSVTPTRGSVGDKELAWGGVLNRVTDSVAAMAALDPTIYSRAFPVGYYQPEDGGGGPYTYSGSTPQSSANGGTIVASTFPGASGCWLLSSVGMVSVKQFGCKGDDVADDTPPWQACMSWCYTNYKAMFLPRGTYKLTSKVSVAGPMTIIGEAISPPVTPALQQGQPVVTIHSTVASGYAMQCGSATYARGGHYENFRIYGGGTAQHGLYLQNQGWDFCIRNVTSEGFTGTGVLFDYVQDGTVTNLSVIDCGTENVYPSFKCINQCNIISFNHLRIEISPFMMDLTNSSDLFFHGCHFEQSEYVSGAQTALNRYSRHSTIVGFGCTDIQFDSCIFAANSVQGVAAHFGVSANTIDYAISFNGTNIRFSKCRFAMNGANRSSRYLNFNGSSSTSVTECTFEAVYTDVNSITLSGTTFVNNDVTWMDDGVSSLFYGIANSAGGSPSIVENNRLYCINPGGVAKTAGYLLTSQTGGSYLLIGYNQISITKYYKHHNAASIAKSWMQAQTVDLTGFSGTLDLELFDINTQFKWAVASTVGSIINMCSGQRVKLWNNSVGTLVVANSGNVVLKGASNASVPQNGVLSLEESGTGFLIESSRNF